MDLFNFCICHYTKMGYVQDRLTIYNNRVDTGTGAGTVYEELQQFTIRE